MRVAVLGSIRPAGHQPGHGIPGLVVSCPPGLAGGAGQRAAPGVVVRTGGPGLRQVMVVWSVHRGLLVPWLGLSRGCGWLLCGRCHGGVTAGQVRPGRRIYHAVVGGDRAAAVLVVDLLGPVEIGPAGGPMTPVAQPRLRVLLGLLGVAGGRVVSAEALVDGVWGEEWSPGREKNLHTLVYQLRRRLAALEPGGGARLTRAGAGYRLVLGPGELDVAVFRELAGRAREAARAGDDERARELFGQALGLWRGGAG
jgi:Transcriptional regulatory protein, C terminal/Bacterial transcriptional activator domain